jgi:hypothetical protein
LLAITSTDCSVAGAGWVAEITAAETRKSAPTVDRAGFRETDRQSFEEHLWLSLLKLLIGPQASIAGSLEPGQGPAVEVRGGGGHHENTVGGKRPEFGVGSGG